MNGYCDIGFCPYADDPEHFFHGCEDCCHWVPFDPDAIPAPEEFW